MDYMKLLCLFLFALFPFLFNTSCSEDENEKENPVKEETVDPPGAPPKTWKEHWGSHQSLLQRMYYNDDVVIYFDEDIDKSITWPNQFMTDVWRYTKKVYGNFGDENRLYVIFHAQQASGGHPAGYIDKHHDYRNVIDNGAGVANAWHDDAYENYGMPVHEVSHIVEGVSKQVRESPAFDIWGDSKWAEIFAYDVFLGIGKTAEAKKLYDKHMNYSDNFPSPGTYWFRDWFYPIYKNHGGSKALNGFFELLAKHFPKVPDAENDNKNLIYSRRMNYGEFVHFWSGAAGTNLKEQATLAFGWPAEWEAQFIQAQKDFPGITY
ncbi:hypothetical protein [Chryseosolibacter indicus]|uniref:Uncharacterized protein n=1 Tax=Chryseosolibacter indicus TaxID=2782351 RepID=A0ABS5VXF1_9BACT|nr:hypothetical protein [Chryseosolibacter indicus]MBT1706083.1 hypothetical protein [Chryseosolibacter indicus]